MKKSKTNRQAHSSNAKTGMGDFYGSGIKQKVGKLDRSYLEQAIHPSKNKGKAPKSLA